MRKKKLLIFVGIIGIVSLLWFGGLIPKQIAWIAGTRYVDTHFPEMKLECVRVEYSDAFGDYLIFFKSESGVEYSCVIRPEIFPVSLGQGLFALESDYAELYG